MAVKKRIAYRLTAWGMDLCIANSKAGAQHNARVLGLPANRYRIIRNGVDTQRFVPGDRRDVRAELGIDQTSFCAGIFGSFKPQKNHLMFVEAARRVLEARPNSRFLFVGDALEQARRGSLEYRDRVMGAIDAGGISANCVFTGNRDDVERLYRACDVVVLPSLHEGTPNVALEAMASGVPVIATDVADNAEIIPDEVAGFVVPLGDVSTLTDRLVRLCDDADLRRSLSAGARAHAESEFSLLSLADRSASTYRELIAGKSAERHDQIQRLRDNNKEPF